MTTKKLTKLLALYLPYILLGLVATNFGEAWRLAEGKELGDKIMSMMGTIPVAFANPLPSLHPLDLLVGLCCGTGLRLAVYLRGKNAKKYRHGMEYGSARWGNAKDIEPFMAPKFSDNIILTKTERLMMSNRPPDPKNARNKNVLVVGGSGSGKTRFWLKPNLLQCHSSYVVTDPKGTIVLECGNAMLKNGYKLKILNTINFKKSMHYNPFAYVHSEKDILKLVTTLMTNTKGEGSGGDPFWEKSERLLLTALIAYLHYEAPVEEQNFATLLEMLNTMQVLEDDEEYQNPVDLLFEELAKKKPNSFAGRQYKLYKLAAGKTAKSILISCGARLAPFDIQELRDVTMYDELQLDTLGDKKTALFLIMSDTDSTFNFLISMHDMFNMDGASKFHFDWKDLVKSGLSVKDAIAPTAFAFKNSRTFQMGGIFCAASFLSITASDISDQLLKDFLDMDSSQIVTMHIQSVDQNRAIKTVKRTITELDRSKIEEQKKAIRAGYDIDIIPSDLATYGRDAKALLKELQSQNERMFLVTFLVLNTGRTEQELENNVFQASSIAQKHNCNLCRLDYQQEQGLMSSLPLADCQIEIQRGLTTSSTAIFIPFTTQELYQSGKESLYYGLNALSNNLIMVDRKKLKNPNGLILGTPGSGKSFSAKREIANAFLVTDDDIIVNDPEGEYSPLVNRLKGQVIKISPNSTQFVNPMDINANYSEEDNPLSLKADFILSLCELVVGGKEGLLPVEKTVIDRCVHLIYRKYFADPCPENMPILEDLYNALLQQDEKEAHHVATALEIYVKGSLNLFNHRTNVNVNNRIVCYDIKELGKQMKKLGMLVIQDQVWGRVTANRTAGKSTRYYADEFHLLLKEEQTAAYSVEIWKRFRKWGGIPTGLTQNVKDLLSSREVENIFENSDMIIMLNQAAGDRQILAKQLNISPHQLSYVTHSGEGEGLLFFGNVILPFVDRFPTDLELYKIMTTKLGEVSEGAQK